MHSKFVGHSTDITRQSKTNAPLPTQQFHKERAKIGFFSHNLVCILKSEMECVYFPANRTTCINISQKMRIRNSLSKTAKQVLHCVKGKSFTTHLA